MFIRQENQKEDPNTMIIECSCWGDDHMLHLWYDNENREKAFYFRTKMMPNDGKMSVISRIKLFGIDEPEFIYRLRRKTIECVEYLDRLWKAIRNKPLWNTAEIMIEESEAQDLSRFITSKVGDGTDDLGEAGKI